MILDGRIQMGTRADFYVGEGESAEWLGSIAWDGYPEGINKALLSSTTEAEFRRLVTEWAAARKDFTAPESGWPWPWDNSQTTDFAYAFLDGKVRASSFGHPWFDPLNPPEDSEEDLPKIVFPDMKNRKNVQFGGDKSGVIVVGF